MMLLGTRDGEGSGTGESPAEISGSQGCLLGCLLGCPLGQREVNVEWVICIYLLSENLNIPLSSCLNVTSELFGYSELSDVREYRRLLDVRMDFGFSFDAAPTIDTVLYFGVSELSEMNEAKIEIDRRDKGILEGLRSSRTV